MIVKFFLFIFLFIVFMVLLFGVSFLRILKRLIFGSPRREETQQRRSRQAPTEPPANHQRTKIISKDEGEYVDYEEVKDPPK